MQPKQQKNPQNRPTKRTYASLEAAYDRFNATLFDGTLPSCLITVQRHRGAYGYFSGGRFVSTTDPGDIADEIALNPRHFATLTPEKVLSTLAHEMVHLWQHHYGRPSKAYHNQEWARKMRSIGLIPTDTGAPGGKEIGQRVSDYIADGGCFAQVCAAFLAKHPAVLYHDRAAEAEDEADRRKKAASKTKFTCPDCGANAWGKADLQLLCGGCIAKMTAAPQRGDDPAPDNGTAVEVEVSPSVPALPLATSPRPPRFSTRNFVVRNKNRSLHARGTRARATHQRRRKKRLSR